MKLVIFVECIVSSGVWRRAASANERLSLASMAMIPTRRFSDIDAKNKHRKLFFLTTTIW